VAQRLQALVRKSDTVARMGGDEFVLILKDVPSPEVVTAVATKIRDAMAQAFDIEGHAVQVGGSIGVALYPGDGTDGPALLKCADVAMYDAKQAGRGQFRFFKGA
jgi:diguanylate cyclase (GGDEF)-like protein